MKLIEINWTQFLTRNRDLQKTKLFTPISSKALENSGILTLGPPDLSSNLSAKINIVFNFL